MILVSLAVVAMIDSFKLSAEKKSIMMKNEGMASKALRVLAFSYKDLETYEGSVDLELEDKLKFLGLIGIIDPPREEVKEAIKVCKEASIFPVMITGDLKITVVAIAEELGMLNDDCYTIDGREFQHMIVLEDKSRIVKMWQKKNKVVAMTEMELMILLS